MNHDMWVGREGRQGLMRGRNRKSANEGSIKIRTITRFPVLVSSYSGVAWCLVVRNARKRNICFLRDFTSSSAFRVMISNVNK